MFGLTLSQLAACFEMCILQQDTSPESILGMIYAFKKAKHFSEEQPINFADFVLLLASEIDEANKDGLRSTPVYFRQTMQSIAPPNFESFEDLMNICFDFISGKVRLLPDSDANAANRLYYDFQQMHPFGDGNGRVGWLIWLMLKYVETGQWLCDFPPDYFGENKESPPRPIFSSDFETYEKN